VEGHPDGLLVLDRAEGTIRYANPAAAALLGRPAEALTGQPLSVPSDNAEPAGERRALEARTAAAEWDGQLADLIALRPVEEVRPLLEARRHRCTLAVPGRPVRVDGDPLRLGQVLVNLLDNAARYTEPGGRVDVTVRHDGGWAVVEVADNGVGIAPQLLPR